MAGAVSTRDLSAAAPMRGRRTGERNTVRKPLAQRRRPELEGKDDMAGLSEWAESTRDALALVTATERRTFAELDSRANQLARALLSRSLQPGDAVALIGENSPAFVETVFASQRAGFRLTPVNWHLTAEEAAYIVQDCEAKALVTTDGCGDVAGRCFRSAAACTVGLVYEGIIDGFESYDSALAAESIEPLANLIPGTTMLYTSGTTADGEVGRRGHAPAHRPARGDPQPHGSHHVPPTAVAARRRANQI